MPRKRCPDRSGASRGSAGADAKRSGGGRGPSVWLVGCLTTLTIAFGDADRSSLFASPRSASAPNPLGERPTGCPAGAKQGKWALRRLHHTD
jgi:hypothetical protein